VRGSYDSYLSARFLSSLMSGSEIRAGAQNIGLLSLPQRSFNPEQYGQELMAHELNCISEALLYEVALQMNIGCRLECF